VEVEVMTIKEIDELMEDTRRLPRVSDKVALASALAALEIAKQLILLNENVTAGSGTVKGKTVAAGKKR
jgi:hypothetical protein